MALDWTPHTADAPLEMLVRVAGIPVRVRTNSEEICDNLKRRYRPSTTSYCEVPLTVVLREGNPIALSGDGFGTRMLRGAYQEVAAPGEGHFYSDKTKELVAFVVADHCLVTGEFNRRPEAVADFIDLMVTRKLLTEGHRLTWGHGVARNGHGIVLAGLASRGSDIMASMLVDAGYLLIGGNPLLLGSGPLGPQMIGASGDLYLSPTALLHSKRLMSLVSDEDCARYALDSEIPWNSTARVPMRSTNQLCVQSHPITLILMLRWSSYAEEPMGLRDATDEELRLMLSPFRDDEATDQIACLVVEGAFDPKALAGALDGDARIEPILA